MLGACFAYEEAFPRSPLCYQNSPLGKHAAPRRSCQSARVKRDEFILCVLNCCILSRKNYLLKCGKRSLSSRPCVIRVHNIIWIENCDSLHAGDIHVSVFLQSIVQRNQDFFSVDPPLTLLSLGRCSWSLGTNEL